MSLDTEVSSSSGVLPIDDRRLTDPIGAFDNWQLNVVVELDTVKKRDKKSLDEQLR